MVPGVLLARRHIDLDRLYVTVRNLLQQMSDAVKPCTLLIVRLDNIPRGLRTTSVGKHLILSLRILHPMLTGFDIHRAELPTLDRIVNTLLEAPLLLFVVDREPI